MAESAMSESVIRATAGATAGAAAGTTADRTPAATRRARWSVAVVAALLTTLVACSPLPPHTFDLRTDLQVGSLTVSWNAPAGYTGRFDVQVRAGSDPWQLLDRTTATQTALTDAVNATTYDFRVRTSADGVIEPGVWSATVTALYVDLVLPVVRIDTGGVPIADRENYVPGTFRIEPNGSEYAAYSGTMGIRGRGNSTWDFAKKPYRVKLDTKSEIMGIAAERDWVLLANFIERSQLRTVVAMEASRATDLAYTPTVRHVEVVLDGHYEGAYLLTQHNEIGPDRIDIEEMGPEDTSGEALTGGYLLEIDFRLEQEDEPGFRTAANVPIVVKDPDPMAPAQRTYIRNRIQSFENALLGPDFTSPTVGYRSYLDVDSFIDHYLVQELTRNQDVFHSSTFFTKRRGDDLFRFGPVWDFDRSIGTNGGAPTSPTGWWARTVGPWAPRLFQDPTFVEQVEQRWAELKPSFDAIVDGLEARGAVLGPVVQNDAIRWSYPITAADRVGFLIDWLTTRIAWMDAELGS